VYLIPISISLVTALTALVMWLSYLRLIRDLVDQTGTTDGLVDLAAAVWAFPWPGRSRVADPPGWLQRRRAAPAPQQQTAVRPDDRSDGVDDRPGDQDEAKMLARPAGR
jgi:hypothetical protein